MHLAGGALFGLAAVASNPDYYVWAIVPLFLLILACSVLARPESKKLLLIACMAVGLFSFTVGRFFFSNGKLDDNGFFIMLALLPILLFIVIRLYVVEADSA